MLRLEYAAGERMFVDFSGDRMPVTDPTTGEVTFFEIFVAVLGASGMLYVEATRGQDLKSWLLAHVRAYEAYGGVPRVTVPDNLKSGVTKACWYDPEVNPSYLQLARHFNTVILPTRTAKPRDKAAAEAGVLVVERWVLAPLRNHRFFGGGELNRAIGRELTKVNGREFRGQPTSRRDLFLEIERPALQPLPPSRYEFTEIKKATANIDYHVEFDHHFYSVPYQLVRQRVEVWATATTIEIDHRNRRVASHAREYGRRRYITDPSHRPASHRAHLEWTPSRLIKWAGGISPAAAEVAERILLSKPHPEHGYRACLGLMNLAKRYTPTRVAAACERALAMNATSCTSVKSILAQNLDRLPLPSVQLSLVPPPPAHENLRGLRCSSSIPSTSSKPSVSAPWRTHSGNSSRTPPSTSSSASRTASDWRDNRRLASRLKAAKLRHAAAVVGSPGRSLPTLWPRAPVHGQRSAQPDHRAWTALRPAHITTATAAE